MDYYISDFIVTRWCGEVDMTRVADIYSNAYGGFTEVGVEIHLTSKFPIEVSIRPEGCNKTTCNLELGEAEELIAALTKALKLLQVYKEYV